jgi:hypothetical protein
MSAAFHESIPGGSTHRQIRQESEKRSQEGDAQDEERHAEKRQVGQEGDEQEAGDRDRPLEGPEEGGQSASQKEKEELTPDENANSLPRLELQFGQ